MYIQIQIIYFAMIINALYMLYVMLHSINKN